MMTGQAEVFFFFQSVLYPVCSLLIARNEQSLGPAITDGNLCCANTVPFINSEW